MENKKLIMTLLCTIPNINVIISFMQEYMKEHSFHYQEEENVHSFTLKDYTRLYIQRSPLASTPENFINQMNGMMKYYSEIITQYKDVQQGLLQQLRLCNNIISYEFEITEDNERNKFLFDSCIILANEVKGCIIMSNLDILNYEGKLILNQRGESELETLTPTVVPSNLFYRETNETDKDREIYLESINFLKENNIKCIDQMELALRAEDIKLKSTEEIAKRLVSLFTIALYSEAVTHGFDKDQVLNNLSKQFNYSEYLSDKEKIYISTNDAPNNVVKKLIWRYEACAVLLYSLGYIGLNNVNTIASVETIARTMKNFKNIDDIISNAQLIDINELHKLQDLTMRYHWALIDGFNNKTKVDNVIPGIILERHIVLNWLLTDLFGNSWDKIQTPA